MTGHEDEQVNLITLQRRRQYNVSIRWALDIIFTLQVVNQTSIKGMRRFGCASKFGEFVSWHGTPVFVVE